MSEPKYSPWFNDEQPKHNGMYQRLFGKQIVYAYWYFGKWYQFNERASIAFESAKKQYKSRFQKIQTFPWRGITA